MPPKRASSTKSTAAKSTPSKPARPATTAKAAASAGKGKATAAKARAKPKPKPVTKLAPEYPSSTPRRSSRQGPERASQPNRTEPMTYTVKRKRFMFSPFLLTPTGQLPESIKASLRGYFKNDKLSY